MQLLTAEVLGALLFAPLWWDQLEEWKAQRGVRAREVLEGLREPV